MKVSSFSAAAPQNSIVAEEAFLVHVVNIGDLEKLKSLLGIPMHKANARGEMGVAAFMRAASLNRVDMMELLSPEYGLKLNERNAAGETALMQAVRNKSHDAMVWLIKEGADVNIMDHAGSTPLLEYVKLLDPSVNPNVEMLRLFLCAFLDFDAVDADGRTALMLLAKNPGEAKFFLLDAMRGGSGINAIDKNGCTALHFAAEHRRYEFGMKLVEAGVVVRTLANDGRMARDVAMDAAKDDEDYYFAKLLDDAGDHHSIVARLAARAGLAGLIPAWNENYGHGKPDEDESDEDESGLNGLVRFAEAQSPRHFSRADYETDFSELGYVSSGNTQMLAAAKSGIREYVSFALKSDGVNIDVRDVKGWSPLMCAAASADRGFLKFFIDELDSNAIKFNVNLVNDFNADALILSAQRGNRENMKILLQRGAGVNVVDKNGNDVLMAYLGGCILEEQGKYDADRQDRARGVARKVDSDIKSRDQQENGKVDVDLLRLILSGKVNAGRPNNSMQTATMLLSGIAGKEAKELFLKADGVVDTLDLVDINGKTALMYAMNAGDEDYFGMLIEAGADINLQVNGYSSRSLAQKFKLDRFLQIIDATAKRTP